MPVDIEEMTTSPCGFCDDTAVDIDVADNPGSDRSLKLENARLSENIVHE